MKKQEELHQKQSIKTNEILLELLEKGAYFGEVALLTNLKRTASVRAHDFCTVATLHKDHLQIMQQELP